MAQADGETQQVGRTGIILFYFKLRGFFKRFAGYIEVCNDLLEKAAAIMFLVIFSCESVASLPRTKLLHLFDIFDSWC